MKKIIITLVLLVSFATSYGQSKYHEKQNDYYVEAAAKEFDLDKSQQKELSETRMEMVEAYMSSNQARKAGEISKEEMKKKNGEASKTFNNAFIKLTGKSYKELKPFLARMREELKNVK